MIPSRIGAVGAGSIVVRISANQTDYNLRTALGSPSGAKRIIVLIDSGVTISSSSAGTPAFDEGAGWASGTTISIVNEGSIYGAGGAGGKGGDTNSDTFVYQAGASGGAGGAALKLTVPTTITNASGNIFGGGGGGGGGSSAVIGLDGGEFGSEAAWSGGGGGGGGRGTITSAAGARGTCSGAYMDPDRYENGVAGSTGNSSSAGSGGTGGDTPYYWYTPHTLTGADGGAGGDWGTAGSTASAATESAPATGGLYQYSQASGGAAGKAVDLNGQTVSWISGNDGTHVKGAVA